MSGRTRMSRELRKGPPVRTGPGPVAYVMSRFPKLTETFVLYEILALERRGVPVEIFPLLRQEEEVRHAEADRLVARARFRPFISAEVLRAMASFLRRNPRRYLRAWRDALSGTWGSSRFFLGALAVLPKATLVAREMEELQVEHVHAHFANHPTLAAYFVHRITGIPYSFTAHGSDLHVDRRMLAEKVRWASFVVTVSRYNQELIVDECGDSARGKVAVIHCGVDPSGFGPGPLRNDGRGPLRIVCVASLEEVKGHRFLVDAVRILEDRGVQVDCHLIGEGPLRERVRDQVRALGLEHRIRFRGGLPRSRVTRVLGEAHVAVQPSHPTPAGRREGIPVALMEAMAAELPVVASAVSGIPELVRDGDSGILVRSGDPSALAEALERLAGDPDLRSRMGKRGRQRVEADFDLRRTAEGILERIQEGPAGDPPPEPRQEGAEVKWP